jgi:glutamyl-tRNA reductase
MPLLVVGLSHATAPLEVLERVRVPAVRLPEALRVFAAVEDLNEVVVLSTCQRTEVYADCLRFHPAVQRIAALLGEGSLSTELYSHYGDAVPDHIFRVAAGIDSAILGESEILGQVRTAWKAAQEGGTARQRLSSVFRHAIEAGKRCRAETGIGRGNISLASTVVALAQHHCGSLTGRTAVVVGTGAVGAAVTTAFARSGVGEIVVVSRDGARAGRLAEGVDGRTATLGELHSTLVDTDVVVTATDAPQPVIRPDELRVLMSSRPDRPLRIFDVAVPRNVDPDCDGVPGVTLADLDHVKHFAQRSLESRRLEVAKVGRVLEAELDRFRKAQAGRLVAPVIAAFRDRAEEVRRSELQRVRSRLEALPPGAGDVVDTVTRSILNKLLHVPTVRLKGEAGNARGEVYAEALTALFDLHWESTAG